MGQVLEAFCQGLRILLGVLVAALAVPVGMQVLARYTGIIPVYLWTEELSTFIFVWVVMIGSMIAVWEGTHFDVRLLPDARRPLSVLLQKGVVLALIAAFALVFAWYGIEYAKFGALQNSVMMQANKLITFISVPIAGADLGGVCALSPGRSHRRIPRNRKGPVMIVTTGLACAILVGGFLFLVLIRVPVAFALGIATVPIVLLDIRLTPFIVIDRMFQSYNSFILLAVPFFLLAANLMNSGKITEKLIELARVMTGWMPGGLGHVNVAVSMLFAGISGSSTADAAGCGKILIPAMVKEGYDTRFAIAITACSSVMGVIIPPSILMVVWGGVMQVSVGALFLAGAIPGIMIGLALMATVYGYAKVYDYPTAGKPIAGRILDRLAWRGPCASDAGSGDRRHRRRHRHADRKRHHRGGLFADPRDVRLPHRHGARPWPHLL